MAHHKSAKKRIRQSSKRNVRNKYYGKTARNLVRDLRELTDKKQAEELFPKVVSNLDKLVKRNLIHRNKAANLKSKLSHHIKSLG